MSNTRFQGFQGFQRFQGVALALACLATLSAQEPVRLVRVTFVRAGLWRRIGLLVPDGGGEMLKLPLHTPGACRLVRAGSLKLLADGSLEGDSGPG